MESELRRSILLGMAAILAGCGGGDGSEPTPQTPDPLVKKGRIQIRSATPIDSMNEGGMLRAVDQQLSVHSQW